MNKLIYTKNWNDPTDFPTYEPDEIKVRADLQFLFDEAAVAINNALDDYAGTSGAGSIGVAPIPNLVGNTVQALLENIRNTLKSVTLNASGADFIGATEVTGITGATVQAILKDLGAKLVADVNAMVAHKISGDHDERYYLEHEMDALVNDLAGLGRTTETIKENRTMINDLEVRKADRDETYTRQVLDQYLKGGDTNIIEEVYIIVTTDNGDGTFTYRDSEETEFQGELGPSGEQTFQLIKGTYEPGLNRIELLINDALRRSVASGGIVEGDGTFVTLVDPEGVESEITIKYYMRLGLAGEFNVRYGSEMPPLLTNTMWFKLIEA
jgi:hypothetical protein